MEYEVQISVRTALVRSQNIHLWMVEVSSLLLLLLGPSPCSSGILPSWTFSSLVGGVDWTGLAASTNLSCFALENARSAYRTTERRIQWYLICNWSSINCSLFVVCLNFICTWSSVGRTSFTMHISSNIHNTFTFTRIPGSSKYFHFSSTSVLNWVIPLNKS